MLDNTVGEDVDAGDLPEPDSRYVNAEVLATGDAKAIGNVIVADAGAQALLGLAGGARIYTAGPDAGRVDLNLKINAELAASLGLVTFGPNVNGKAQFIATVTLDKDNGYRPSHLRVIGTAGYNGDLGDSDVLLNPTTGQLSEIQDALRRGNLESAAFGSTDGSGQQVEFTGDLDLTTDAERAAALRALTGGASVVAAELAQRLGRGRPAHVPGLRHDGVEHRGRAEGRARPGARRRGRPVVRRAQPRRLVGARSGLRLARPQLRAARVAEAPLRGLPRRASRGRVE